MSSSSTALSPGRRRWRGGTRESGRRSPPRRPAAAPSRQLDLDAFFTGRTHADNDLKIVFHRTTKLIVDSVGHRQGKEFILVDTVHEGDKPVRMRKWVTHQVAPGRYAGTLSDATGPVDITVSGDSATVRYKMKGGLDVVQDHERVLADRRDHRAGVVRGVPRWWGKLAGSDGGEVRGEAAKAGQWCPAGDGLPDLLVRTRRDLVRSRSSETVDDDREALVVARARPDVQHPVSSARSGASGATVAVRIAGVDEMLHRPLPMFNAAAPKGHSLRRPAYSIDT